MGLYKNTNGVLSPIAGRGKAEYGASTVRKGTFTILVNQATGGIFIEFDTPLPDNDYIVSWEFDDCADGDAAHIVGPHYKYATGFGLYYFGGFTKDVIIRWTAFKLYTDNEYNGLLNNQRYSIDEIDTGKTWIDGKKIYRKVVDCGAGPAAGVTKTVNHNIANIERFTHLEMIGDNNTNYWPVPWFDNSRKWYWYASRTAIFIASGAGSDATSYNHLAILEYTKTT